jgi:hypothetical protein
MLPGCPEARNDGFYVGKYGHAEPFHKEICRDDGDAVTYLVHIISQGNSRYKSSPAPWVMGKHPHAHLLRLNEEIHI